MEVILHPKRSEGDGLPAGWRECDISDLCQLQRGFDLTEATRKKGTVPVYSSSGISYFHNEAKLQPPAVITGRKGQLGKVFLVEEPCWPHDTTLWVKDFRGNDPQFVSIFLGAFHLERFDASTSVPTLNRNNLFGHLIRIPPLPEQRVITKALSDVDSLLRALKQLVAKKRDLKQAAMHQLLTGKIRLPGFHGEWEFRALGDLGSTFGGLTGKTKADFGEGPARYVTFMNVMSNVVINCDAFERVRVSPTESQNRVMKGDLLFNGSSETPEEVALCSVLTEDVPNLFLNSFCFGFRFREAVETDGLFLAYYLRSKSGRELMKSLAQGSTRYNLSKVALLKSPFLLPGMSEQKAIAAVLSDMDAELAALEQRLAKTRALKQGMMQELLTGRTRLL